MKTYQLLARRYNRNFITLEEFRLDYMPHIKNEQHLLRVLGNHPAPLRMARLHQSQCAQRVVFLTDLAEWLDQIESTAEAV